MPYRPLHTGESHSETCPQLGYMGYSDDSNRNHRSEINQGARSMSLKTIPAKSRQNVGDWSKSPAFKNAASQLKAQGDLV